LRTRQLLTRLVIWAMVPILLSACGPSLTGGETEGDTLPKVTASLTYSPAPTARRRGIDIHTEAPSSTWRMGRSAIGLRSSPGPIMEALRDWSNRSSTLTIEEQ
jgi:hypothetical protein